MNQQVKTWVGTVVIIIMAITAIAFVWVLQKNNPIETQTQTVKINSIKKLEVVAQPAGETTDWQTYRNEKYGFEFQYPKDWKVEAVKSGGIGGETFWVKPLAADDLKKDLLYDITIFKSKDDPKTWYSDNYEDTDFISSYKGNTRVMEINGVPVFYAKETKDAYVNESYVIASKGTVIFASFRELSKSGKSIEYSYLQYLPDFERLINSIKFN